MALRLNGQTTGYTELNAPANGDSVVLTMPGNDGNAGQYLQTDGSGALSWQTVTTGQILQVQTVTYRGYQSYTMDNSGGVTNYGLDNAGFDATVLDLTITPASTNSRILLLLDISFGTTANNYGVMRLKRGINGATPTWSTAGTGWMGGTSGLNGNQQVIGTHEASNIYGQHNLEKVNTVYVDSPATTDEIVYRINFKIENDSSSNTFYLNRSFYQNNDYGAVTAVSSVTALEIAS